MQHENCGSNAIWEAIRQTVNTLGLEEKDINEIQKMMVNKNPAELNTTSPPNPVKTYKQCGGYYGTISINDFN